MLQVGTAANNSQAVFAALGQHFTQARAAPPPPPPRSPAYSPPLPSPQLDLDEFWAVPYRTRQRPLNQRPLTQLQEFGEWFPHAHRVAKVGSHRITTVFLF